MCGAGVRAGLDLLDESIGARDGGQFGLENWMATVRSCLRSSARQTVVIPPAPSSRSMR